MDNTSSIVILINDRFFYRFGSKGQILTAWHIAGAQIFMKESHILDQTILRLNKAQKKFEVKEMQIVLKPIS